MTSAYIYADDGGHRPAELQAADFIERFGGDIVFGRRLYAGEIYRMNAALNVYHSFVSRKKATDWATWTKDNPQAAELLANVAQLITEKEND